jgi:hypothetical protein
METFSKAMNEYRSQLQKGYLQEAYQGLMLHPWLLEEQPAANSNRILIFF